MFDLSLAKQIQHAWNAFRSREPTRDIGQLSYSRPDRHRSRFGFDRSIVTGVLNRISIDAAAIRIRHVRVDENDVYIEDIKDSRLNYLMNIEANLDQTGRAFFQDVVFSMLDEGIVAIVPVDTTIDPTVSGSFEINELRTGKIVGWFPQHVRVSVYNQRTGIREEVIVPKRTTAIIENPLYAVMNEPNSILQRLIRKLNILDAIDEKSGSGKLDIIMQLPYTIKTEQRRKQAEKRIEELEQQLANSRYGIAYADAIEKITQLNRPAESNLMTQIEYLTSMLYGQLGISQSVFDGTADEPTMLNYHSRTLEPILSGIADEIKRKFLTKTAITQKQSIEFFKDVFKLAPVGEVANLADKFTRNEIMSPNEIRGAVGMRPSDDPKSDELRNRNINAPSEEVPPMGEEEYYE